MSLKPGDVDRVWEKLGFEVNRRSRDIQAVLKVGDRLILWTRRSHGSKGTSGRIGHFIRQQMKLNEEQFSQALACPLTREGYHAILREKGFL